VNTVMKFRVPYMLASSRVAAQLAVSQEGLSSMSERRNAGCAEMLIGVLCQEKEVSCKRKGFRIRREVV
jgi:hypothetical protein